MLMVYWSALTGATDELKTTGKGKMQSDWKTKMICMFEIPAERLCAWHGVKQRQQSTKTRCGMVGAIHAIHVVVTAVACRATRRVQNEYAQQRFSKSNV
jgi:hypothetical protein